MRPFAVGTGFYLRDGMKVSIWRAPQHAEETATIPGDRPNVSCDPVGPRFPIRRHRTEDDGHMPVVRDRNVSRLSANFHTAGIGSRIGSCAAVTLAVVAHQLRPGFWRAGASGGRALKPQRPMRASATSDFNLATSNDVLAAGAKALVVERLPVSARIQLS